MAETTQDATVIDNEAAEQESSSLPLPLLAAAAALVLALIALIVAFTRGGSGSGDAVSALEGRLAALEGAPTQAAPDLSAVFAQITIEKALQP